MTGTPFVNVLGAADFIATRPLASFFTAPYAVYQRHDQKPADDRPPPHVIPPGPQIGPGFVPVLGMPLATYAPGVVDDGWVPGGYALRLGGG